LPGRFTQFGPIHDVILFYAREPRGFYFKPLKTPYTIEHVRTRYGTVVGTNDDGGEWTVLGELAGAADMTFTSLRDGLAVRRGNMCAVEVMDTADAAGSWDSISCVLEETDLEPQSIAQLGDGSVR